MTKVLDKTGQGVVLLCSVKKLVPTSMHMCSSGIAGFATSSGPLIWGLLLQGWSINGGRIALALSGIGSKTGGKAKFWNSGGLFAADFLWSLFSSRTSNGN